MVRVRVTYNRLASQPGKVTLFTPSCYMSWEAKQSGGMGNLAQKLSQNCVFTLYTLQN